jgi:hypothetical protein
MNKKKGNIYEALALLEIGRLIIEETKEKEKELKE